MAYADKCFYHDFNDREIKLQNHKDGWTENWDLKEITLRKRWSGKTEKTEQECISIEVWPAKGECVELILSKDNAAKLAHKLMMSIAEMNTEDTMRYYTDKIQKLENKVEWLEPVIEKEKKKFFGSK